MAASRLEFSHRVGRIDGRLGASADNTVLPKTAQGRPFVALELGRVIDPPGPPRGLVLDPAVIGSVWSWVPARKISFTDATDI